MHPRSRRFPAPRLLAFVPAGDPVPALPNDLATEGRPPQTPAQTSATEGREFQVPAQTPATIGRETQVSPLAGFYERHRTHLLLGGAAVAVGLAAWTLSGDTRENPSCGPACGCAPCRARYRGNPSRTRRSKRAARRAR
jgi:hypothetical protein